MSILLPLLAGYATIILGDFLWLGYVTQGFIKREFGPLVTILENGSIKINLVAGLTAWAVIVLLVYLFVIRSGLASSYSSAFGYGGLMGLLSYAMYDLTNLTFIKGYSLAFTFVDIAWGAVLCAIVSLVMYSVSRYF